MIENTTNRDHGLHLAASMGRDPSKYITDMEAAGQQQLVNSDRLPVDTHGQDAAFIALGFTFGPPDADDPLFRPATLPAGWTRRASDHDMWSHLLDENGVERVSIFYKAAFYDRRAHMGLAPA